MDTPAVIADATWQQVMYTAHARVPGARQQSAVTGGTHAESAALEQRESCCATQVISQALRRLHEHMSAAWQRCDRLQSARITSQLAVLVLLEGVQADKFVKLSLKLHHAHGQQNEHELIAYLRTTRHKPLLKKHDHVQIHALMSTMNQRGLSGVLFGS